jgi:hypothetical protein
MDPQETALLASLGKSGWRIVSRNPDTQTVKGTDSHDNVTDVPKYPGGIQWVLSDGLGHNTTMVVVPKVTPGATTGGMPAGGPGAQGPTTQTTTAAPTTSYSVVEPPANTASTPATPQAEHLVIGGVTYEKNAQGQWAKVDVPGNTGPADKTPTPLTGYVPIKNDKGETVRLVDPNDPTKSVDIPAGAAPPTPAKPTIVQGAGGAIYSWDGSSLTLQQAGTPVVAPPKQGDTRRNVVGGMAVQEKYDGGSWVTDPSVAPTPYDTSKPKDGDTRPNTDAKGQQIQEVFKGGSWVTDTSVPPKPFGFQAPTNVPTNAADATIVQMDPTTGKLTTVANPNYHPAQTDVGSRVQQLQAQAQAKQQELQTQVLNGSLTQADAQKQFGDFWNTQIEPQKQALAQDQQQQAFTNQIASSTAATNRQSVDTAGASTGAGMLNARAAQATTMFNNVLGIATNAKGGSTSGGASWGSNYGIGGAAPDISGLPDAIQAWQTGLGGGQSVYDTAANLVKNIDPTNKSGFAPHAAAVLGQVLDKYQSQQTGAYQPGGATPPGGVPGAPAGMDINALLNQGSYSGAYAPAPPVVAPPPTPMAATSAPTTTIAPDGTITINHVPSMGPSGGSLDAVPVPSY